MRIRSTLIAATVALLALGQAALATDPNHTVITVPDLHCGGCAKQVAAKLYEVSGVATIRADVQGKLMYVEPHPQRSVSPRQLWEAVEKAGKRPSRMQGPGGTFTAKPQA